MIRQNKNEWSAEVNKIKELSEEELSEITGGRLMGPVSPPPSPPRITRPQPPQPPLLGTHGDVTAHATGNNQVTLTGPGGQTNTVDRALYDQMVQTGNIHLLRP
jgi:bacteriocin-like protein